MLTHVYDQVTETMFIVARVTLEDDEYNLDGTMYSLDLISQEKNIEDTLFLDNVPMMYNEEENSYYLADISTVITDLTDTEKTSYDYNNTQDNKDMNIPVFEADYNKGGLLTNYPEINTEPHTTVSIYQSGKEPTIKEATTIPELIEILEDTKNMDYTEVVVSGAFTNNIIKIRRKSND